MMEGHGNHNLPEFPESRPEAAPNGAAGECPCRHKHRDPKEEKDLISRLNRIEGQVRGIKAMVLDDRYCTDILVQVSAVQSALNGFSKMLLSNHIKTCAVDDIKNGKEEEAIKELCETIKKMM